MVWKKMPGADLSRRLLHEYSNGCQILRLEWEQRLDNLQLAHPRNYEKAAHPSFCDGWVAMLMVAGDFAAPTLQKATGC
jgi:hypothetical protein